jgi:tRNA pseudouridine synthase 10
VSEGSKPALPADAAEPGPGERRSAHALPRKPKVRLFLEGRYRKLVRDLPQTVHYCPACKGRRGGCTHCEGRGKLSRDSVQELIARQVLPRFKAREGKFHGAGREDVDVRMLGSGRPFVYEVVSPKNPEVDVDELVQLLNEMHAGRIEISPLRRVERRRVAALKEASFAKVYAAKVRSPEPVPAERLGALVGARVEVRQRTPERVAHRRADLVRVRQVTIRSIDAVADGSFRVELRCDHGTYVKEWISGDGGRTEQSLAALLGIACVCEELDVLEVLSD